MVVCLLVSAVWCHEYEEQIENYCPTTLVSELVRLKLISF